MASDDAVDLYGASYDHFATELYAAVRRQAFGDRMHSYQREMIDPNGEARR